MASFRFVGGPFDGHTFDHTQINAVASVVPVPTQSGMGQFLLMPPPEACERILRGEATKDGPHDTLHPYERTQLAGGGFEYRHAVGGRLDAALRERDRPLRPDEEARRQSFGEYADRFIAQLRGTELTGDTEVSILLRCVDQQGREVPPIRETVTATTTVRHAGDQQFARELAAGLHLDSIIGNINSMVRNAPTGFFSHREHPGVAMQIVSFDLEITSPTA